MLFVITLPPLTAYAVRLYVFSLMSLRRRPVAYGTSLAHGDPLVSVLLPLYDEEKVVDRLMESCTSFLHDDYEVVVIDDSTDSTTAKLEKWRENPKVKVIHRGSRTGWKGGALNEGLKAVDPRSKYCYVLDADALPPPDLLDRFIASMERTGADLIQGAQTTDVNSGESWVASATSLMLSGFNLVELEGKARRGLIVPITGSNFMAKTSLLKEFGFDADIAEDWSLTARLWAAGRSVLYEPSLIVKSESPSTLSSALKQFSRWAEGTTRATARLARLVAGSVHMTLMQKADFFLSGLSYFSSVLFILIVVGGILMPVPAFSAPPTPFLLWGTVIGLLGLPAAPLSLMAAKKASETKYGNSTIIGALVETYIMIPFTAYATLKGLLRGDGAFERTKKSGWTEARHSQISYEERAV